MEPKGPIYTKSFEFALMMIELHKKLNSDKLYDIARQILRSGTSVGANINEAGAAISKKDFTHKMSIASKEARESLYWLRLMKRSEIINMDVDKEHNLCLEMVRLLTSIVKTSQLNTQN